MFSGIIKSIGVIQSAEYAGSTRVFKISSDISATLHVDQSISHDGVCLTIVKVEGETHTIEIVSETLSKTTAGTWNPGHRINLEKAISPVTLLDGHMVQGHVDTTLICTKKLDLNGSWRLDFHLPEEYAGLVIPQGSICINGVSLTVADLTNDSFSVAIIPYTYHQTNFNSLNEGDAVNVEFDLIGKYIIRQLELRAVTE